MKKQLIIEVISFLFILLFVYAGTVKLVDYQKFTVQIGQSPLLAGFQNFLPLAVISIEIIIAAMLVIPKTRHLGFYSAFALMVMFTVYIIAILNFSPFVPCSCGGVLESLSWDAHLYFNCAFVLLAVVAIFLMKSKGQLTPVMGKVGVVFLLSVGVVAFMLSSSGILKAQQNSFLRTLPPHPVLEKKSFDLKVNSWYIAGGTTSQVYLGNYNSPLDVNVMDVGLQQATRARLDVPGIFYQKFWGAKVSVDYPYFYLWDGTVARIYRGTVNDWKGSEYPFTEEFFLDFQPMDSGAFAIKYLSKDSSKSVMGKFASSRPHFRSYPGILQKQIDGVFCTDGIMVHNGTMDYLIYVYRYRNEYIVMNKDFSVLFRANTIDSNRVAKIRVATISSTQAHTMSAPPLVVNRLIATSDNRLFVNSKLLASNEADDAHKSASVIDVYDLTTRSYVMSFYLYHFNGKEELRDFAVFGNRLIALFDTHMQAYELRAQYFPDHREAQQEIGAHNQEE